MLYDSQPLGRARIGWLLTAICTAVFSTTGDAQSDFDRGSREGIPVNVTGTVTALVQDDFEHGRSDTVYFIRDEQTGQLFRVRFNQETPGLRDGTRMMLTGRARESDLYVVTAADDLVATLSTRTQGTSATALSVSGDRRAVVMVANFADATVACSVGGVRDIMFTDPNGYSVAALYRENSRGQLSLSGDVVGTFNLTARSTDTCDLAGWAEMADAAATASGVDLSLYSSRVYVMPDNSCVASGYGTMAGSPGRAWIFSCGVQGIYAHELGHTLGMDHSGDLSSEFGDWTDPMGMSTTQLRGLNAPHRHQFGWLAGEKILPITQSGYYDIAPLSIDPATAFAPQAITIRKPDTGEYYYLSYRTSHGFDKYISGFYLDHRVSVHRYKGDGSSARTYLLAGLADGVSFVDEANGIKVTTVSHTVTHATVRVEFNSACPVSTPSMSLTPRDQKGAAGDSATYAISIVNNDGPLCPASTLTLSSVVPGGWSGTVAPSVITVAPGATEAATFTVRSASDAPIGTYNVSVDSNDSATPLHGTLAYGTYAIEGDNVAPTAPSGLTATANQKQKQIDLSWSASTDNVSVAAYGIIRNGGAVGTSKSTRWADATWTPGATFTYSVVAYDQRGNASPHSNSVTIKLNGGESGTGGSGGNGSSGGGKKP